MSRASEAALKAYPIQGEWVGNQYGEWDEDKNQELRKAFLQGYEQAEKVLNHLAQLWADSGDANVMSFEQFLKCYEAQSNK